MKRVLLVLALVALVVPAVVLAGHNSKGGKALVAKLNGHNELNATTLARDAGDLDGKGHAVVRLNAKTLKVCWAFNYADIATPLTGAHVHVGTSTQNGSIVVALQVGSTYPRHGCVSASKATIDAILANPAGYYVNLHTSEYPGGAIRGQLKKGAPS